MSAAYYRYHSSTSIPGIEGNIGEGESSGWGSSETSWNDFKSGPKMSQKHTQEWVSIVVVVVIFIVVFMNAKMFSIMIATKNNKDIKSSFQYLPLNVSFMVLVTLRCV